MRVVDKRRCTVEKMWIVVLCRAVSVGHVAYNVRICMRASGPVFLIKCVPACAWADSQSGRRHAGDAYGQEAGVHGQAHHEMGE